MNLAVALDADQFRASECAAPEAYRVRGARIGRADSRKPNRHERVRTPAFPDL